MLAALRHTKPQARWPLLPVTAIDFLEKCESEFISDFQ